MPLDRTRIEYFIEDLKSRPERMRLVQRAGIVAGVMVALLLVYLLTLGTPPKPKPKAVEPGPVLVEGVKGAFEYAKAAQAVLDREERFGRVYFVPSAATPTHKYGKVMVMGEIGTESDLEDLQMKLAKMGVPVPVEWQVAIQAPASVPTTPR